MPSWAQLSTEAYPSLSGLVSTLDAFLIRTYPDFFGSQATHPVLPLKRSKVIHDTVWGTNRYSWQELVLIDSPLLQRLQEIQQVGLAHLVYPSARHTRFEHTLGVVTIASRVFDAIYYRQRGTIRTIVRAVTGYIDEEEITREVRRLRQELRLGALLHDTGHSLFSHASEKVYGKLPLLKAASKEVSRIVGLDKGAGEALSFGLALAPSVRRLVDQPPEKLIGDHFEEDYTGPLDFTNVALLIVGRTRHPFLQFLADIISSSLDADKLDYLMRDAMASGLPLRYDLDMYLYSARVHQTNTADGDNELKTLYDSLNPTSRPLRNPPAAGIDFESYDMHRLRLPKKAMHVIEQIVICKLMLFSYMYHHSKARAAEGMLEAMLDRLVAQWRKEGLDDTKILENFMLMTDGAITHPMCAESDDPHVVEYCRRINIRLLPREVYSLSKANASHADGVLLVTFLNILQDKQRRPEKLQELETAIGNELVKLKPDLGQTAADALAKAGVWVDVAKPPKFEDLHDLVVGAGAGGRDLPVTQLFPIGQWQQAWTHYRYNVRIYSFSESIGVTEVAAMRAMQRVIGIEGTEFYSAVRRARE